MNTNSCITPSTSRLAVARSLPSPDNRIAGWHRLDFQVAQKLHAGADPHDPPASVNDRARDLVDLILLRDAFYTDPETSIDPRSARVALFEPRATEAGVEHDLDHTVALVNDWVHAIARA